MSEQQRVGGYKGAGRASIREIPTEKRGTVAEILPPDVYTNSAIVKPQTATIVVDAPNPSSADTVIQVSNKAGGLAQTLGLDPRVALIAIVLDTMLFAGEIATVGVLIFFSCVAGLIFGFVTYRAQIAWFKDERDSALIKALIMGLLTAIPSPLPAFLYVPAGIVGTVKKLRGK